MPNPPYSSFEKLIGSGLLLTPLIFLCVRYLDIPVALYVKNHLYSKSQWTKLTSNLPDLLLMVVLISMLVSLSVYLARSGRGIYDTATGLAKLVLWAAPASYLTKTVLKFAFGRVNTRYWLEHPDLYGFHWFQMREGCQAFPSGHMLVIVALLAAFWRFCPRTRPLCLATGTLLAAALVATNYHFVGDVIAGAYLGVLVEAIAFRLLFRDPPLPGVANS